MKSKYYLFVFFSFLLLFFCGKSDQTYTIEIKDGVKHVHNLAPAWGDTLKVALEFVQKIGVLESEDENYLFFHPNDVIRDSEGNIFILDAGNYRVQKFDEQGKFLTTFCRQGQGPGEISSTFSFDIDPESRVFVGDHTGRRFQVFSSFGEYLETVKSEKKCITFRIQSTGEIVGDFDLLIDVMVDKKRTPKLLGKLGLDGKIIGVFCDMYDYKDESVNLRGNYLTFDIDSQDNVWVSFGYQNRIEKYSPDGTLLFCVDRPLNYKITNKYKEIMVFNEYLNMELALKSFISVSKEIGIDQKNRVWIGTYQSLRMSPVKTVTEKPPADLVKFEIYDENGVLLGKLPVPEYYNQMRIFDDRLYLIDISIDMCVYEYKIVEK